MRSFEALRQSIQDRLHGLKIQVSPEEQKLLGVTPEDLASFSDESLQHSPAEIAQAIDDIIFAAYENVPEFQALVKEDVQHDPQKMAETSQLVSRLLGHLRGVLPPEKRMAIKNDTYLQAREIVKDVLIKYRTPEVPAAVVEEKIDPVSATELQYFNLTPDKLTQNTRWEDIKDNVLYFLGKFKGPDGKTVKNEYTAKMPEDTKITVLSKLLNDIRQKKIASGKKFMPSDYHLLGKNTAQLKQIARSIVVPPTGKPDPVYTNDLMVVNSQSLAVLEIIDRLEELFKDKQFNGDIDKMIDVVDSVLPPVNYFQNKLDDIREQLTALGLTKAQASMILSNDPDKLTFDNPINSILEEKRKNLSAIEKQISDSGETDELKLIRDHAQKQVKQLEDISSKDMSGLKNAVESYMGMVSEYRTKINDTFAAGGISDSKVIKEFTDLVDDLALRFNRLAKEEMFRARWKGRSGYMVKNLGKAPAPSAAPGTKEAAASANDSAYSKKLQDYRGKGVLNSYQGIKTIIEDDTLLPAIRSKLISILNLSDYTNEIQAILNSTEDLETKKNTIINLIKGRTFGNVSGQQLAGAIASKSTEAELEDFLTNPKNVLNQPRRQYEDVVSADIDLDVAIKTINQLRSLSNKIDLKDKESEATEVMNWIADLNNHFKAPSKKMASEILKKVASFLITSNELKTPEEKQKANPKGYGKDYEKYQSPSGTGSDRPYPTIGDAEWIIYRERLTKMGKKSLKKFLEDPTFVAVFMEEMEKAGLNKGILEGGKMPPVDIDKVLESVINKVTGKSGGFENILPSMVMQEYKGKKDIQSVKKELDEALDRRADLNTKIFMTEERYIPKLTEFANFIENPIAGVVNKLMTGDVHPSYQEPEKKEDVIWERDKVEPEIVDTNNYQSVLSRLYDRYHSPRVKHENKFTEDMFKQAAGVADKINETDERIRKMLPTKPEGVEVRRKEFSETSKKKPTDFFREYQVWKKRLKDMKKSVDSTKDPYKRLVAIDKYYAYMLSVINNIDNFFDYQDPVIKSDRETIKNLEAYLNSDEGKKERYHDVSMVKLRDLKKSFSDQDRLYSTFRKTHDDLDAVRDITKESIHEVRDDIEEKEFKTLMEVAVSPELVPDKKKEREILQRAREHEKGLSFIIDRYTYKKNMNKIMEYKPEKDKVEWGIDFSNPTFLPPERKKELEDAVKKSEEMANQLKSRIDYEHKLLALKTLEKELEDITKVKNEVAKRVLTYEEALKMVPWSQTISNFRAIVEDSKKGTISDDMWKTLKEEMDKLDAKVPPVFNDVEDMEKKLREAEKEKNKDTAYIESLNKKLQDLIDVYKQQAEQLKTEVTPAKEIDPQKLERIKQLEERIPQLKAELEKIRPPEDVKRNLENVTQLLYRIRLMDTDPITKPRTLPEKVAILEKKLGALEDLKKINFKVQPGSEEQQMLRRFLAELEHQISITRRELEKFSTAQPGAAKTAAFEDPKRDLSPIERALEERGKEPPPFIKEIKKPKGWEVVEDFFNNVKREHSKLKEKKEKGMVSPLRSDFIEYRINQLEQVAKAVDTYKKQLISMDWWAPDPKDPSKKINYKELVPFEETMNRFDELLFEYQDQIRKYTNQRDDTDKRISKLQQEYRELEQLFDPDTGKFKGMSPEKISSLKNIFLRMLYRDLESKWATNVGKQLPVFGDRDTDWYNNVYHTFKEIANARSNKKMLGIINKYKQETRSDMDDIVNRKRSQQLRNDIEDLRKGYERFGIDPAISSRIKDLETRLETVIKQEKQIDRVFNFMGTASLVKMQSDFEQMLKDRIEELSKAPVDKSTPKGEDLAKDNELEVVDVDLTDEADEELNKALNQVEEALPVLVENKKDTEEIEKGIAELSKAMREERKEPTEVPTGIPTEKAPEQKVAYDKNHRDFNLKILYGSHMQSKIAEMLSDEIK